MQAGTETCQLIEKCTRHEHAGRQRERLDYWQDRENQVPTWTREAVSTLHKMNELSRLFVVEQEKLCRIFVKIFFKDPINVQQ